VVLTAGPGGEVKATFDIDLPRPRVVQEIRFDKQFVDIYQNIWEALREEVDIAYAQTTRTTRAGGRDKE
jgi:NitT/TauT family transport system ATP-binding protein